MSSEYSLKGIEVRRNIYMNKEINHTSTCWLWNDQK